MSEKPLSEYVENSFNIFTQRIRPRLSMAQLQSLAAFTQFLKTADVMDIPGYIPNSENTK